MDPRKNYVYEEWIGCGGIGFARSTDGGGSFQRPTALPGSTGSDVHVWDPAIAVAPDGTVYAAYMIAKLDDYYPVVAVSDDNGSSFSRMSALLPPEHRNWGDRDFIAVAPDGTIYVTWDYAPERNSLKMHCGGPASCSFAAGEFNIVIQSSTDQARTWSEQVHASPAFPAGGADSAPLVIEPDGRIDVVYQRYDIANQATLELKSAHNYFTSSTDRGRTWSPPMRLGPDRLTMAPTGWWINGDVAMDAAGNLYSTWDTTDATSDVGWLAYSSDHGATWSQLVQGPLDKLKVPHIIEVAGLGSGMALVGWLSPRTSSGYELDIRLFSIDGGWLSEPFQLSTTFGSLAVWPGDRFGITALDSTDLMVSWGGAPPGQKNSQITARRVAVGPT